MYVLAAALTLTFICLPEHSCEGVVDDSGPRTGLYWAIHTSCMRWPTVKLAYECYCTGMSGCRHRHNCGMAAATCENATIKVHRVVMRLRMAKNGQLALPGGAPAGLAHAGVSPRGRAARGGGEHHRCVLVMF